MCTLSPYSIYNCNLNTFWSAAKIINIVPLSKYITLIWTKTFLNKKTNGPSSSNSSLISLKSLLFFFTVNDCFKRIIRDKLEHGNEDSVESCYICIYFCAFVSLHSVNHFYAIIFRSDKRDVVQTQGMGGACDWITWNSLLSNVNLVFRHTYLQGYLTLTLPRYLLCSLKKSYCECHERLTEYKAHEI